MELDELITTYFSLGLSNDDIVKHLKEDGVNISLRTVKRRLNSLNLFRRKNYTDMAEVLVFLEGETKKSSSLHGYKWMWLKMIQKGFVVTQETVRIALLSLDPGRVEDRAKRTLKRREYYSQGANFTWHLDGYDKLKPFGISISGAVDGFSRFIIWLKAAKTNKDPKVVARFYVDAVENIGGCPKTMRADHGTENVLVKEIQEYFRSAIDSRRPAFLYGKSVANQRIESFWSILRKHNAQYWIDFFYELKNNGYFDGSYFHKTAIQFTFMKIIQAELDEVIAEWNCHRIRKSKNSSLPSGKPINLFRFPEQYAKEQCLISIENDEVQLWKSECKHLEFPCDEEAFHVFETYLREYNLPMPDEKMEINTALEIYKLLIEEITLNPDNPEIE